MTDTNIFCEALEEKNRSKLLQIPKSDLHNHSSKGCRREWLEGQLIHAADSKNVMQFLADSHIQLNVCPSSNVMLGYAKTYKDHPIKILYENGVKVTINTDDLLLFDSSIENEYLLLYQAETLSAKELDEIRRNGIKKIDD